MRWALLLAVALTGCLDSVGGAESEHPFGFDMGGDSTVPPPDVAVGACVDGVPWEGVCVPFPPTARLEVCDYLVEIGANCEDVDEDCYVGPCVVALPDVVRDAVDDCDDHRPDVRPGGTEVCDGADNDCDGFADDGLGVGEPCDACGEPGKVECAVDGPRTACSTAPGQTAGPSPDALEELCNGEDDDCDGVEDETCRLDLAPRERWRPVVCGDGELLLVEDGAVVALTRAESGSYSAEVLDRGPVAFPACGADGRAWLQVSAPCAAPPGGPLRCPRAHLLLGTGRDVTGNAELGPPVVGDGMVWWHAIVGDSPVVQRTAVGGGHIESPFEAEALSDPTPPVDGLVAMRAWTGGEAEVVVRRVEDGSGLTVLNNGHAAGPPALSASWVVWPVGDAGESLWAVPLAAPRDGFQLTTRDGPQRAPRLDGELLVWLDDGTRPATLRSFDLSVGVEGVVARGDIGAEDYAVAGGVVVWIEAGERVYRASVPHSGASP